MLPIHACFTWEQWSLTCDDVCHGGRQIKGHLEVFGDEDNEASSDGELADDAETDE